MGVRMAGRNMNEGKRKRCRGKKGIITQGRFNITKEKARATIIFAVFRCNEAAAGERRAGKFAVAVHTCCWSGRIMQY